MQLECPICAEVIDFSCEVCPICSEATGFAEAVPAGGLECPVCAEVIEPSCDVCPICSEATGFTDMGYVEDNMACPICAENIPSASQVCPVCAEPLVGKAPSAAPVLPPHSGQDEVLSAEDDTWDLVKNSGNIADIEYYLENYPNGKYSIPANLKMRQLGR
jgi:RNA polymerase subunit RPABC4/transcription elongation factor Spt4|tara:strand:- start:135 stop:617 length:483 start_codon:yes stop_codon:yes gene_type:complete